MASPFLWRVSFAARLDTAEGFAAAIEPFCFATGWFEEPRPAGGAAWRVEGFSAREPDRGAFIAATAAAALAMGVEAPSLAVDQVLARDWLSQNRDAFPPLRHGRYFIHGSHIRDHGPAGCIPLHIDAGSAFGSGEHASTAGCLLALDRLARRRRFQNALDLGCGSGILALAIAKTWRAKVVATDIDPDAAAVTRANARINGLTPLVRVAVGNGYDTAIIRTARPFDLIVANVLARPLVRLAGALARHLAPDGIAILSGFIDDDWAWVAAAHRAFGLGLVQRVSLDGWTTLVLSRSPRTHLSSIR
jgi:ribosomal protein L11 methyltransferase